ncbi:MAG: type III-B CRISPR module RAMP protein Cmr1, partial [Rhabdochlamydiaceae bacterium]
ITPLFGGGVVAGEVDPVTPIRGSEIRGHLRFWWRATRGGLFGDDLAAMQKREGEIWGTTSLKEKKNDTEQANDKQKDIPIRTVQIEVIVNDVGKSKRPFDVQKNKKGNNVTQPAGVPEYATFPLLPTNDDLRQKTKEQIEKEMKCVQHNIQFTLKITYPDAYRNDIQATLWAWETFGGIGARTRRGFGALHLLKIGDEQNVNLPTTNRPADVRVWLNKNAQVHVVSGVWPGDVAHLEQTLSVEPVCPDRQIFTSWNNLITRYASFRQSRSNGNTGRSNWPEAEAIRKITNRSHYRSLNHPQKFPRAAFGLPIIFHFKDEKQRDNPDPKDTTLQGAEEKHERLASPLILRPLICNDGNAIGLATLLHGSV